MMETLTVTLLLLAVLRVEPSALAQSCKSGQYTNSGECCHQCQPGEGVLQKCGVKQTVCSPCLDSETFSENYSHTETCQPCTKCGGLMRMQTPCTDSNDAVCVCDYGYYMSKVTENCEPCTLCPVGMGVLLRCDYNHDTVCEECQYDTYSDQESSLDPCLPCTICDSVLDLELQPCSGAKDTVCQATDPQYTSVSPETSTIPLPPFFTESALPVSPPDGATTTRPSSVKPFSQGLNKKLIPIYCSILAAVVVGLVAFVVFKKWNSCKQNKQGANNCTVSQTPSPEGEKLHSDSGISVDSQSLQEQQQQMQTQTVLKIDGDSSLALPPHKCEEVEKLLNQGSGGEGTGTDDDTDWCNLAGLLGYEVDHINSFRQEEHPIRALLTDWASKDCASLDALCSALRKINRDDIAQSLITATSAV